MKLSIPERVVAGVCLVQPFRVMLNDLARVDLHLGFVSFAVVGAVALAVVRERPLDFPSGLDLAMAAFVLAAFVDLVLLTGPSARAFRGFSLESRFVAFYLAARILSLRREFARWLAGVTIGLGILTAVLGALEYHLAWGTLLKVLGRTDFASFVKFGIPRLYSFPLAPLATAYLMLLALAATFCFAAENRRGALVAVAVVVIWQALPLTLARAPLALAVGITVAFALFDHGHGRRYAAVSGAAIAAAVFVYALRGWLPMLFDYLTTGTLTDESAAVHRAAISEGFGLILLRPLGYGFGESGSLASQSGGAHPYFETQYVSIAVQMGLPGLVIFLAIVALSGMVWLGEIRSPDRERRALGLTGGAIWATLAFGGLVAATWSMSVPQLYFWLLTGVATNLDNRS